MNSSGNPLVQFQTKAIERYNNTRECSWSKSVGRSGVNKRSDRDGRRTIRPGERVKNTPTDHPGHRPHPLSGPRLAAIVLDVGA